MMFIKSRRLLIALSKKFHSKCMYRNNLVKGMSKLNDKYTVELLLGHCGALHTAFLQLRPSEM